MPIGRLALWGRAVLLGVIITFTTPALLQLLPNSRHATAEATVAFDDSDRDKEKEREKREKEQDEDRIINGQVLDIDTLKDPPELVLGSVDGLTVVKVLKTDEIAKNAVHLGDYIQADGEKINEQLFEATQLSVSSRYSDDISENDNN